MERDDNGDSNYGEEQGDYKAAYCHLPGFGLLLFRGLRCLSSLSFHTQFPPLLAFSTASLSRSEHVYVPGCLKPAESRLGITAKPDKLRGDAARTHRIRGTRGIAFYDVREPPAARIHDVIRHLKPSSVETHIGRWAFI